MPPPRPCADGRVATADVEQNLGDAQASTRTSPRRNPRRRRHARFRWCRRVDRRRCQASSAATASPRRRWPPRPPRPIVVLVLGVVGEVAVGDVGDVGAGSAVAGAGGAAPSSSRPSKSSSAQPPSPIARRQRQQVLRIDRGFAETSAAGAAPLNTSAVPNKNPRPRVLRERRPARVLGAPACSTGGSL